MSPQAWESLGDPMAQLVWRLASADRLPVVVRSLQVRPAERQRAPTTKNPGMGVADSGSLDFSPGHW